MSRAASATINYTLTAFAQGHMNDLRAARQIVDALCPTVQVTGASGQFKKFSDENSFQVYVTDRGLGGTARRIEFSATDGSFNCKPQALEVTVDNHERDLAAASGLAPELLDQGKIKGLLGGVALSHVNKIVTFVDANTTPVAGRGEWSNPDIDPIDQLDEQLELLVTACGSASFITLTMGAGTWRALRNHPKVKARAAGVKVGGITVDDLRGLLMFPVNVVVGVLSKKTTKPGGANSKAQVLADVAYLSYSVPNPTIYDPSPFKCFTTGENNIEAVRTYRDESARSDVHAVDWSEDPQAVSSIAIRKLAIT